MTTPTDGRDWKPIETAPRDRTVSLARYSRWPGEWKYGKGRWLFRGYWGGDVWSWPEGLDSVSKQCEPTHWAEDKEGTAA